MELTEAIPCGACVCGRASGTDRGAVAFVAEENTYKRLSQIKLCDSRVVLIYAGNIPKAYLCQ